MFKSRHCCVMITGASKGFGKVMAEKFLEHYRMQFASQSESSLTFVLFARSKSALETLSDQLKSIDPKRINCEIIVADLCKPETIETFQKFVREKIQPKSFGHIILVHNAGSTSICNKLQLCQDVSVDDYSERNDYYRLNLFSVMELTGVFLRELSPENVTIVNISSLAAIQPIHGLMDYCVGKAARDQYFRQLSLENKTRKSFRILNYAPGPLDTEMFRHIQQEQISREQFQNIVPLEPEISAKKLLNILHEDRFKNGDHIDYFDQDLN